MKINQIVFLLIIFTLFVSSVEAVPIQIDACQTLSIDGGSYILNQSVSATGTCFTIGANNITLDGAGWTLTHSTSTIDNGGIYDNTYDLSLIHISEPTRLGMI